MCKNGAVWSRGGRSPSVPIARPRIPIMSEATQQTTSKSRPKPIAGPAASAFEFPKFEIPNFEMPKLEVPAAFREFAEKGASQAKETYDEMKAAAEEATDVLEDTYANAAKGAADYGLKLIEATRA